MSAGKARASKRVPVPTLPPPATPDTNLASLIRALLPERTAEDILAGVIRLKLGDQELVMPVLPIAPAREWKQQTQTLLSSMVPALSAPNANAQTLLAFLAGQTDDQLALLYAYDQTDVLPKRDYLEAHANDAQLLTAVLAVLAASFPLAATAIAVLRASPDIQTIVRTALSLSTSSPRPPTAGASPTSSVN